MFARVRRDSMLRRWGLEEGHGGRARKATAVARAGQGGRSQVSRFPGFKVASTMLSVTHVAIRLAAPEDIDAVLELERGATTAAHWSRAKYEAIFQPKGAPRLCLVVESDSVQAFLVAQTAGPEWELENIVVAASARRQGLGTGLISELLKQARQRGAQAVVLEVRPSNAAARYLYQSGGFVEAGLRPRYYQNPQEDAIVYRCNLD